MPVTLKVSTSLLPAVGLCLAIVAGSGCTGGAAEATGDPGATAALPSAGTVKFHVVLGEGPFKGTYDVASDACLSGIMKAGSWHATWEADMVVKDKMAGIILGIDPKPVIAGAGISTMVTFGENEDQVMYEVLKPEATVDDRGSTATLKFKGNARIAFYKDGSFADGGQVEITIECGKVQRG